MKKHLSTVLLVLIVAVGLGLLLYPSVSNYWNSLHSSRAISSYVDAIKKIDRETYNSILQEAREYNQKLYAEGYNLILPEPRKESYFKLLDVTGTGIMGYIEIKKLNVYLPIYHGTSDAVLQTAVGHIEGSFLPVGGENTHSVLSGHRGLPSAKLFSELDLLTEGDMFTLSILNETFTYEVDQIRVIEPDDISALQLVPGEDLCTLFTCTPYGVNSHRLLVRGHRVENTDGNARVVAEALLLQPAYVAPFIMAPFLIFLFLVMMLAPVGLTH